MADGCWTQNSIRWKCAFREWVASGKNISSHHDGSAELMRHVVLKLDISEQLSRMVKPQNMLCTQLVPPAVEEAAIYVAVSVISALVTGLHRGRIAWRRYDASMLACGVNLGRTWEEMRVCVRLECLLGAEE